MYLKSLTLKGFKSFASATTLKLEPGITAVVGPNGSGKSNVVDALTWVMGEQGAKALRGGKMEDVIFAGTAGRAPLGRAEVTLTIDNADGALPIDYTEVSITRRMFRDGASEYEINGSSARLMDVQELLSDSGIGREMHVIVGQGRLAAILESRPEDRRAFIEEAAGVLKHRRRKEKAVRKLDSMQANLARLTDLTTELRRQLKPLGRQAEVARRAQTIQADLRDARLRLAADDLVTRRAQLAEQLESEQHVRERFAAVSAELDEATAQLTAEEARLAALTPAAEVASNAWFTVSALAERVASTVRIAQERARHLETEQTVQRGEDPEAMLARAEAAAAEETALADAVETARTAAQTAKTELAEREQRAAEAERAHLAAVRAVADRREGLARLAGQVETLRTRAESIDAELERLGESITGSLTRRDSAQEQFETVQQQIGQLDVAEEHLDASYEAARRAAETAQERLDALREDEKATGQQIASLRARIDALTVGLARKDGPGWVLEHRTDVRGRLAEQLKVTAGFEAAIEAALGSAADAIVMGSGADALETVAALRDQDGGHAALIYPAPAPSAAQAGELRWAAALVDAPAELRGAVRSLLGGIVVVDDAAEAITLIERHPELRAVTRGGEIVGAGWVSGGSAAGPGTLEIQAAIETSTEELRTAEHRAEEIAAALSGALTEHEQRAEAADQALAALNESDAAIGAIHEQLARLGQDARLAEAESGRLTEQRSKREADRAGALAELSELQARLAAAQAEDGDADAPAAPSDAERAAAAEALATARAVEVEARLAVRTAEERHQAVAGRAEGLRRGAEAERQARLRAEHAARARVRAAALATTVAERASELAARLEDVVAEALSQRDALTAERGTRSQAVDEIRAHVARLTADRTALTDAVHRDELVRAEVALKIEQLEQAVVEQHAIAPDALVAEYGPEVELPPSELELAEYEQALERGEQVTRPQPLRFDRTEQERRAKRAERDLATLGRVNPLALEEFAALEERYTFLSTELEDVKSARKDLLDLVSDVDAKILQVFTEAYADVEREFKTVFATLFPGGEGRLLLTDPSDMLTTGVEVEARPPGKKVKRLSLLSGGEKSLTAVAMLVAIFRARPSPFYVMDEVEAALDDTNLRRLLALFEQLREQSQLIVITHQKATMELADALYGVSMRGDGITTVISQRMRGQAVAGSATAAEPGGADTMAE